MKRILFTFIAATIAGAATASVAKVGPPLDGPVVALFVPPTRATKPVAATASAVHAYDDARTAWSRIYDPAPGSEPIYSVSGYAKNSGVLYVAHKGGIAVSSDSGETWTEGRPADWSVGDATLVSVSSATRKQAIVASGTLAWMTRDFGATWRALDVPSLAEPLVDVGWAGIDNPALFAASRQAIYAGDVEAARWSTLSRHPEGPARAARAGSSPLAATWESSGQIVAWDLLRPGWRLERPAAGDPPTALALDYEGAGALWCARGTRIEAIDLRTQDSPATVGEAETPIAVLAAHPRERASLYAAAGDQVLLVSDAFGPFAEFLEGAMPPALFSRPAPAEGAPTADPGTDREAEAAAILDDILRNEPPVEEVVAAALRQAQYRPGEVEDWKRNVRRSRLLPELRVMGGAAEGTADQYGRVTNIDRFGVETRDDLRSDDDVRYMNEYGIELRWQLGTLMFNTDQIAVSKEARERAAQRNDLVREVTGLYHQRVNLLVQRRLGASTMSVEDHVALRLRLAEATGLLNAICGEELYEPGMQ